MPKALPSLSIFAPVTAAQQRNQRAVRRHGGIDLLLKPPVPDPEHAVGVNPYESNHHHPWLNTTP
jgi:hypothetical protein